MLFAALLMAAQAAPAVDWGARLRADATAFRDAVADSHPGPIDSENPRFNRVLAAAYARALLRARTTTSFPQYVWALREFGAAFDDGHVGVDGEAKAVNEFGWHYRWPGFATALRGGKTVVVVSEGAGAPPLGAELKACDGQPADALAAARIGHFMGRWMLASRREALSGQLFLPPENPWLAPIRACTFGVAGKVRRVTLDWQPIPGSRRMELLAAAVGKRHTSPVSLERLADGSVWINLGSFDPDAASPRGKELAALIAQVAREAGSIRSAPRIVFDLRGNNGGSSSWISAIASSLWGQAAVDRAVPDTPVDWRTSDANYRTILNYVDQFGKTRAENPGSYDWAVKMEAGLREARAQGLKLWREMPAPLPPADPNAPRVTARTFVLTDFGCGSACLDAVDVLTGVGAVQVGQETGADTQYMEIRQQQSPDGARMFIPMKVYRDRRRGANEPAVPAYAWTGDMGDTEGLRKWIAALDVPLAWLVGDWRTDAAAGKVTSEHWGPMADGRMTGSSLTTVNGKPGEREAEWIGFDGATAVFTASPNGAPPVAFREVSRGPSEIVFENAGHDYPQRIRYWREGGTLMAEISLADGSKPTRWRYRRVK